MEPYLLTWFSIQNLIYGLFQSIERLTLHQNIIQAATHHRLVTHLRPVHEHPPQKPSIIPHLLTSRAKSSRPKTKSTLTEDSRPRKKQRSTATTTSSTKPPPPLPVIRDIPPGGFNSDESEDANDREHSRSNSAHTTVVPVTNPVTPVNNPPQPPSPAPTPTPIAAKSSHHNQNSIH